MLGIYQQATSGIFTVLVGVVALSLLVGGIVIMNIMLMAVSERTREIGLRKALGAKRRDIMSQFLTESVTLSSCGGVVGIVLGFVAAQLIAYFSPLPATLEIVVCGAGYRNHSRGWAVFWRLPGAARGSPGSDRGAET